MEGPAGVLVIRDLETLRVVTDPLRVQIIEVLLHAALSPKEIADKLGVATSKLYYHLALLEKSGFVAVVETRTVANLIEKVYRATASGFDIDPALLQFSTLSGHENIRRLLAATLDATREDLLRSFQARAFDLEQGAPAQERRLVVDRQTARMTEAQAAAFRERLVGLIGEFCKLEAAPPAPPEDAQVYNLTLVFYPSFYFPTGAAGPEAAPPS